MSYPHKFRISHPYHTILHKNGFQAIFSLLDSVGSTQWLDVPESSSQNARSLCVQFLWLFELLFILSSREHGNYVIDGKNSSKERRGFCIWVVNSVTKPSASIVVYRHISLPNHWWEISSYDWWKTPQRKEKDSPFEWSYLWESHQLLG